MTRKFFAGFLALVLALSFTGTGAAQSDEELKALRKEIDALRRDQAQIRRELHEIKALLRGRAQAAPDVSNVVLSVSGAPFKGAQDAKVIVVEFSDYECPFCARHARETLVTLEREYVATGKVKYMFRNFPIESIHPQAFKTHEAAACAGEQGKYWEMHERLFANPRRLAPADLSGHARSLDVDLPAFQQCVDSARHASRIRHDLIEGQRAGVQGTPTFFLGLAGSDDAQVTAVRVIRGAQPYAVFKQAIESLLTTQK